MKLFARVDFSDDDSLWATLISGARERCEVYCQRRFIVQTMRLMMDFFPGYVEYKMAGQKVSSPFVSGANAVLVGIRYAIILPYPQVQSVVNFQYLDANGNPQTLVAGTSYIQDLASQPARLMPVFGNMWPVARVVANAVTVDYATGYGQQVNVTTAASSAVLSSSYTFLATDVGRPISIPGAGAGAGTLVTSIASVAAGVATMAIAATTLASNVAAYLGAPVPEYIQIAIMRLALATYEYRTTPIPADLIKSIKLQLRPAKDDRL